MGNRPEASRLVELVAYHDGAVVGQIVPIVAQP